MLAIILILTMGMTTSVFASAGGELDKKSFPGADWFPGSDWDDGGGCGTGGCLKK